MTVLKLELENISMLRCIKNSNCKKWLKPQIQTHIHRSAFIDLNIGTFCPDEYHYTIADLKGIVYKKKFPDVLRPADVVMCKLMRTSTVLRLSEVGAESMF